MLKESDEGNTCYQEHKDLTVGDHNVQLRINIDTTNETKCDDYCIFLDIVIPEGASKDTVTA